MEPLLSTYPPWGGEKIAQYLGAVEPGFGPDSVTSMGVVFG